MHQEVAGECGVCGSTLKFGENSAFTPCKHLFCISCLLKWHAHKPTCPLCRETLYEPDSDSSNEPDDEFATIQNAITQQALDVLDFDMRESVVHQHMTEIVGIHAMEYCRHSDLHCVFMGTVNLFVISMNEIQNNYQQIDFGCTSPNAYYIVMLDATSSGANEYRCRFGRIEELHLFPDAKCVFRERISVTDEERERITTSWASETIQLNLNEVMSMVQYIPIIRTEV